MFDLDREIAAAKTRLHRSIGQRARHAHAAFAALVDDRRRLHGNQQKIELTARMGLRVDNFGYVC